MAQGTARTMAAARPALAPGGWLRAGLARGRRAVPALAGVL